MLDDLELLYDDSPRRRHRHRRKERGRSVLALLLTVVILGALAGAGWYGLRRIEDFFVTPDYSGPGTGQVVVQIKKGDLLSDMGMTLYHADVVKSVKAFTEAAQADKRATAIQPGAYRLRHHMSGRYAVAALLDPKNRDGSRVTIPEGKTMFATFQLLADATKIPVANFMAAAKDPVALGVPAWWFKRTDGRQVAISIEGFLFPDTYDLEKGATATSILQTMVARFNQAVTGLDFVNQVQSTLQVSPFEALIVASLAQAEAGNADDLAKVARVAYNRAYKAKMPLQFDVTANYWLMKQGKAAKSSSDLTPAELNDPTNPYNTTSQIGLPVGPIDSPGEAALKGAMAPPKAQWIYFVAVDKQGHSAFAATLAEHQANIRKACAAGVLSGDACR